MFTYHTYYPEVDFSFIRTSGQTFNTATPNFLQTQAIYNATLNGSSSSQISNEAFATVYETVGGPRTDTGLTSTRDYSRTHVYLDSTDREFYRREVSLDTLSEATSFTDSTSSGETTFYDYTSVIPADYPTSTIIQGDSITTHVHGPITFTYTTITPPSTPTTYSLVYTFTSSQSFHNRQSKYTTAGNPFVWPFTYSAKSSGEASSTYYFTTPVFGSATVSGTTSFISFSFLTAPPFFSTFTTSFSYTSTFSSGFATSTGSGSTTITNSGTFTSGMAAHATTTTAATLRTYRRVSAIPSTITYYTTSFDGFIYHVTTSTSAFTYPHTTISTANETFTRFTFQLHSKATNVEQEATVTEFYDGWVPQFISMFRAPNGAAFFSGATNNTRTTAVEGTTFTIHKNTFSNEWGFKPTVTYPRSDDFRLVGDFLASTSTIRNPIHALWPRTFDSFDAGTSAFFGPNVTYTTTTNGTNPFPFSTLTAYAATNTGISTTFTTYTFLPFPGTSSDTRTVLTARTTTQIWAPPGRTVFGGAWFQTTTNQVPQLGINLNDVVSRKFLKTSNITFTFSTAVKSTITELNGYGTASREILVTYSTVTNTDMTVTNDMSMLFSASYSNTGLAGPDTFSATYSVSGNITFISTSLEPFTGFISTIAWTTPDPGGESYGLFNGITYHRPGHIQGFKSGINNAASDQVYTQIVDNLPGGVTIPTPFYRPNGDYPIAQLHSVDGLVPFTTTYMSDYGGTTFKFSYSSNSISVTRNNDTDDTFEFSIQLAGMTTNYSWFTNTTSSQLLIFDYDHFISSTNPIVFGPSPVTSDAQGAIYGQNAIAFSETIYDLAYGSTMTTNTYSRYSTHNQNLPTATNIMRAQNALVVAIAAAHTDAFSTGLRPSDPDTGFYTLGSTSSQAGFNFSSLLTIMSTTPKYPGYTYLTD